MLSVSSRRKTLRAVSTIAIVACGITLLASPRFLQGEDTDYCENGSKGCLTQDGHFYDSKVCNSIGFYFAHCVTCVVSSLTAICEMYGTSACEDHMCQAIGYVYDMSQG